MDIAKQVLKAVFVSILLLFSLLIFRQPHKAYYYTNGEYIFSPGSAPSSTRSEIITQLDKFQAGCTRRDLDQVDKFIEQLFSKDNLLVLGPMPDEIFIGDEEVSKLIYSDWNTWGDMKFMIDTANISSAGDAAWISTIGYVRFDLPRFLVLPLRLSAVMVKEDQDWKFQSMQFQFDLNLFFLFFTTNMLVAWLSASVETLVVLVVKRFQLKGKTVDFSQSSGIL